MKILQDHAIENMLQPLRGEVLSKEALSQHAGELANTFKLAEKKTRATHLTKRFRDNCLALEKAYFLLSKAQADNESLSAGAEWLLDNFHVVQQQVRQIKRDLPHAYYRSLPQLASQEVKSFPRVYQLSCEYIRHTDGVVDSELLAEFMHGYQVSYKVEDVLTIGEIWAVPIMLRLILVENLRRLIDWSLIIGERRRVAEHFCKNSIDKAKNSSTEILTELVNACGANPEVIQFAPAHILKRLRARGSVASLAIQWFDQTLQERDIDPYELLRQDQQHQAADQISFGNTMSSLKAIANIDWREWFEQVSLVDKELRLEESQIYGLSDFSTRDRSRHRIEYLARQKNCHELEIARTARKIADKAHSDDLEEYKQSVLFYLLDKGQDSLKKAIELKPFLFDTSRRLLKRHSFSIYLVVITLLTAFIAGFAAHYIQNHINNIGLTVVVSLLLALPASEFVVQLVHWFITRLFTPDTLPRLSLEQPVSKQNRTAIAVQTIFGSTAAIDRMIEAQEIRYLGNEDSNLFYVILADLPDAATESTEIDQELIEYASKKVDQLNTRYEKDNLRRFFLLFRKRLWNPSESKYMGWERKRGKVHEFNKLIRGEAKTSFSHIVGDLALLRSCKYVITLDADTRLPRNTARKLVATLAHPLNRAVVDPESKVVWRGYGIIQPRIGVTLQSSIATPFASLFSGHSGLDPYTRTVSDVYQDLFNEGSYIGKGIYEVDAFENCLGHRVPENALLSHDLFEGIFLRSALASDIELFDDFPSRFHAYAKRDHRWIRGDWQLVPWLLSPFRKTSSFASKANVGSVRSLGRWKLFDNLRRSLVAPAIFFLFFVLWIFSPASLMVGLLALLFLLSFPLLSVILGVLVDLPFGYSIKSYTKSVLTDLKKVTLQLVHFITFLPQVTYLHLHAILITLYRVYISDRNLLEWETADATDRRLGSDLASFISFMRPGLILTLALQIVLVITLSRSELILTIPFFMLWYFSPYMAWKLSKDSPIRTLELSHLQQKYLRKLGFDTWCYFKQFLISDYNYLIPDNLQMVPKRVVAERTSPTNLSLAMMSTVASYDLGYASLPKSISLLADITKSAATLERFHGHFLNWYDIKSKTPLYPRYVSTVDNGNFVGHAISILEAFSNFGELPLVSESYLGSLSLRIEDTSFCRELLRRESSEITLAQLLTIVDGINGLEGKLDSATSDVQLELEWISKLAPWVKHSETILESQSSSKQIEQVLRRAEQLTLNQLGIAELESISNQLLDLLKDTQPTDESSAIDNFVEDLEFAKDSIANLCDEVDSTLRVLRTLVDEMEFTFLYDREKKLLHIGYDIDNGHYDKSYYDLLASESRLASFVAIAKGDVPQSHWFALGRSLADTTGGKALLSWSGTMFEYLMPLLVTRDYQGTLLTETHKAVVKAQQDYAQRRRIPWGISESGYSGVDFEKTYQYRAFGVPGLGLKRGLGEDLVVSPYSTALAFEFDPQGSMDNFKRLEKLGVRGEYGFYEAIDYTPERLSKDESFHIVRSFLAHHQGMALIAICNVLKDGIFRERFHSDIMVMASELLLQERFPTRIPSIVPHKAEQLDPLRSDDNERAGRTVTIYSAHTKSPRLTVLSNGSFSLCIDNAGGGFSKLLPDLYLTRWRKEPTMPEHGLFIYIHDTTSDALWSTAYLPTRVEADSYQVDFHPDKVEFSRRDFGITAHTEITVSPEETVEIRRVSLTNTTPLTRELELTSFAEICLATLPSDIAHPAFSKMFIQAEHLTEYDALLFHRRPRHENDPQHYLFHLVAMPVVWAPVRINTQREEFIGRGFSIDSPRFFSKTQSKQSFSNALLDPIMSLSSKVEIDPGSSQKICFITGVASSREEALELVRKYRDQQQIQRAFEMAWSQSDIELRHDQFSLSQVHSFQDLAHGIIYSLPEMRSDPRVITKGSQTQSALWRLGISGDQPIVLLELSDPGQFSLVQEMLLAHEYLRQRGIQFDLVVLNEYPGGYMQHLQEDLDALIRSGYSRTLVDSPGGVFLRIISQMSDSEVHHLRSLAAVVLHGSSGSLSKQLPAHEEVSGKKKLNLLHQSRWAHRKVGASVDSIQRRDELEFDNGIGGFSAENKSYVMYVEADGLPPAPWSNVIGSQEFGFLITESGAGYTWAENSRENRLSPWSNDPVLDPPGEAIYLRDCSDGHFWSPTTFPVSPNGAVRVEHAPGYSSFRASEDVIDSELVISGDISRRVKWYTLKLKNTGTTKREIEAYFSVDCVLGIHRNFTAHHLESNFDINSQFLYVQNPFHLTYAEQIVFIGSSSKIRSFTSSRSEFFGRNSNHSIPQVLLQHKGRAISDLLATKRGNSIKLDGTLGAGFDVGMILQVSLSLEPGQEQEVQFYLAQAEDLAQARSQAKYYSSPKTYSTSLNEVRQFWDDTLGRVAVQTPDSSFDLMVNSWLQYQTLSCRMFARSGFYQSSGAFGFRDQLQDSLAFLVTQPEIARKQILLHASRQFVQGDVQHWWHPPTGQGIRTRISDGYLWLPFAVGEYIKCTGDDSILNEEVSYLEAPAIPEGEMESFGVPHLSSMVGSLYEHCVIALDRALVFGSKGLPLIGGGDWNDGMNQVGVLGKGQSVWLGWFLAHILKEWSEIVGTRRDSYRSKSYHENHEKLVSAIEDNSWDGEWYHRAYFDDGTPIGSKVRDECKIDSLAQSWSVITGLARVDRQTESMKSVYQHLVKNEDKLISLLWPPFHNSDPSPGYIQGYPEGLRENGGQYTHAAAWVIIAEAMMGHGNRAHELFSMINPINHTRTEQELERYITEPYVTCGDVYSVPPFNGRGGWSWYTGSSGWLYRAAIENILGIKVLRGKSFTLDPCIPADWREFKLDYRCKGGLYKCLVLNPNGHETGVLSVKRNGRLIESKEIELDLERGESCEILVEMGNFS